MNDGHMHEQFHRVYIGFRLYGVSALEVSHGQAFTNGILRHAVRWQSRFLRYEGSFGVGINGGYRAKRISFRSSVNFLTDTTNV